MKSANIYNQAEPLKIASGSARMDGLLYLPENARGLVLWARTPLGPTSHHSLESVAAAFGALHQFHIGCLMVDLLLEDEAVEDGHANDIPLLTRRLLDATRAVNRYEQTRHRPLGYFACALGAAAALIDAVALESKIKAIVTYGGRADKAWSAIPMVKAPTMFIVGQNDLEMDSANRIAFSRLMCEKQYRIIPDADGVFDLPGAFDQMIWTAVPWFQSHLPRV